MKESKLKRTLTLLLVVLGALMLTESVSVGRENRKKSSSRSTSKSSGSSRSTGTTSHRTSPPSRSGISSRQSSGSRSNISRGTTRGSRKIVSGRETTLSSRGTRRDYTPRIRDGSGSRDAGSSSRVQRKRESLLSDRSSTLSGDRSFRKQSGYYHPPFRRRSLYHYHRDYYPSRRIFYWISWPNCCRPICYTWGPRYTFGVFWPFYHRKFVFISLGGYWPCYSYRRYYWYGCHPYRWYGDYPPEYVIAGDTYNYYYYSDKAPQEDALGQAHKELEEKPPAEPAQENQSDRYFEQAVKAFETGDYATATAKFHDAQELTPDDVILPFAYVQALFASGEYEKAAEFLRKALIKTSPQKEGVFYPRGLYPDDSVLQQQVEQLARAVRLNRSDSDLELLLGYQLFGMGRYDEAVGHLQNARLHSENSQAATMLMSLLEKLIKADNNNVDLNQK